MDRLKQWWFNDLPTVVKFVFLLLFSIDIGPDRNFIDINPVCQWISNLITTIPSI